VTVVALVLTMALARESRKVQSTPPRSSLSVRFLRGTPLRCFCKSADHFDFKRLTGHSGVQECAKSAQSTEEIEVRYCGWEFGSAAERTGRAESVVGVKMGQGKHDAE
jgi:hypothetical protein